MEENGSAAFDGLDPECDTGNLEYKLHLCGLDSEKLQTRATQLRYRVNEGGGECFYYVGVKDDGQAVGITKEEYNESCENLRQIARLVDCTVLTLEEKVIKGSKHFGYFLVREAEQSGSYVSLTLGVVGNVDAGKSSTIGCLTRGIADDGRGKARLSVFNHKHEIQTGRTSSIGHQILGFDASGAVVNSKTERLPSWCDIVNASSKVISLFDMAGHERYLKTTISGLTTLRPDYALVIVGANHGPLGMTKEHMSCLLTLKVPFIVLVSKIDLAPANVLQETTAKINDIIRKGAHKTPFSIKSVADVISCAANMKSDDIVPVLLFSNVTQQNTDLLTLLLNVLPPRHDYMSHVHDPVELLVDRSYQVTGHPIIVSGLLRQGIVSTGDTLCLGPYFDGSFKPTKVKSIHCMQRDVKSVKAGQYICVSLKGVLRSEIKRGMVLVADKAESKIAVHEFWAFINIFHSPTTVRVGFEPFLHVDQARQSVKILEIIKLGKGAACPDERERERERESGKPPRPLPRWTSRTMKRAGARERA